MFCDRMDVEKYQKILPFSFFGIVSFLEMFFTLHFFVVLQQWMLKNAKGSLFSRQLRRLGFS